MPPSSLSQIDQTKYIIEKQSNGYTIVKSKPINIDYKDGDQNKSLTYSKEQYVYNPSGQLTETQTFSDYISYQSSNQKRLSAYATETKKYDDGKLVKRVIQDTRKIGKGRSPATVLEQNYNNGTLTKQVSQEFKNGKKTRQTISKTSGNQIKIYDQNKYESKAARQERQQSRFKGVYYDNKFYPTSNPNFIPKAFYDDLNPIYNDRINSLSSKLYESQSKDIYNQRLETDFNTGGVAIPSKTAFGFSTTTKEYKQKYAFERVTTPTFLGNLNLLPPVVSTTDKNPIKQAAKENLNFLQAYQRYGVTIKKSDNFLTRSKKTAYNYSLVAGRSFGELADYTKKNPIKSAAIVGGTVLGGYVLGAGTLGVAAVTGLRVASIGRFVGGAFTVGYYALAEARQKGAVTTPAGFIGTTTQLGTFLLATKGVKKGGEALFNKVAPIKVTTSPRSKRIGQSVRVGKKTLSGGKSSTIQENNIKIERNILGFRSTKTGTLQVKTSFKGRGNKLTTRVNTKVNIEKTTYRLGNLKPYTIKTPFQAKGQFIEKSITTKDPIKGGTVKRAFDKALIQGKVTTQRTGNRKDTTKIQALKFSEIKTTQGKQPQYRSNSLIEVKQQTQPKYYKNIYGRTESKILRLSTKPTKSSFASVERGNYFTVTKYDNLIAQSKPQFTLTNDRKVIISVDPIKADVTRFGSVSTSRNVNIKDNFAAQNLKIKVLGFPETKPKIQRTSLFQSKRASIVLGKSITRSNGDLRLKSSFNTRPSNFSGYGKLTIVPVSTPYVNVAPPITSISRSPKVTTYPSIKPSIKPKIIPISRNKPISSIDVNFRPIQSTPTKITPITTTTPITSITPRQTSTPRQTITTNFFVNNPPPSPPLISTPSAFIGGGGFFGGKRSRQIRIRQPKAFTPSGKNAAFSITGKTTLGSIKTGLGERFVIKPKKKYLAL